MTEQIANDEQVDAVFEQMSGEGVAQRMRMNRFRDTGYPCCFSTGIENGFARDRTTRFPTREEPVSGPFPAVVSGE